jgi:phage anti-repressor protein
MNQIIVPNAINFNELVKNSNSTLNINVENKMINKLNTTFTEDEQKWYIANLYMYMHYHPTNDYPINLENVFDMIGFANKGNAKRTLDNNFTNNEDYKITILPSEKGQIARENIMLNIDTFKNLCMLAKTKKGKEIRKYYVKLEMIYNELIKEEFEEQKQQLENKNKLLEEQQNKLEEKDNQLERCQTQLDNNGELQRHNILLREYSKTNSYIVYLMRIKTLDGPHNKKWVIKIGESRMGILNRYKEHKSKYPECLILDVFLVKRSKEFEKFLHQKLNEYRYKNLIGHENENELFLVGEALSYNYIKKLIHDNISNFNDNLLETQQLTLEIQSLKLENQRLNLEIENRSNYNNTDLKNEIINLREYIKEEFKQFNIKLSLKSDNNFGEPYHANGKKIQQINPDTLQLIKVYNNVQEVSKIFNIPRSSLVKAINENLICKMFRWCYVNDIDENKVDIQPTRQLKKVQNNGYIAKLNNNKSEILNVYLDRKTACLKENYNSIGFLDNYVKCEKPVGEYYYVLYDSLDKDIKQKFLIKNNISNVILYKDGVGKFDSNNNLIEEFKSKDDCIKNTEIGQKSLVKALEKGIQYNNYYYKYLNSKLFI